MRTMAITMPASTTTTIATCIQIQDRGIAALGLGRCVLPCLDVGHRKAEAGDLARQVELEPARHPCGQRGQDDLVEAPKIDGVLELGKELVT